jgi:uncharacterized protein YecT (DUF1311 family)
MKNTIIMMTLFASFSGYANAATQYRKCMNSSDGITVKIQNCIGQETTIIDKKLNETYATVVHAMPPSYRSKLTKSEQAWIKYRSTTVDVAGWQMAGGTGQSVEQSSEYLALEKSRLKFLKSLLPIK